MTSLGLLGKSIQHSKSKKMYEEIFNRKIEYHLFDYANSTDIPSLGQIFKKVQGLSITAPYKEHFVKQVKLDDIATKMGAINCIKKWGTFGVSFRRRGDVPFNSNMYGWSKYLL